MWQIDADTFTEGCLWPVIDECDLSVAPDATVDAAMQTAIGVLWAASGRQFGECITTIRPCPPGVIVCAPNMWDMIGRATGNIDWVVLACGSCRRGGCACSSIESFRLPYKRVSEILSVTIDGIVLPPTSYRLDNGLLIRTDGEPWPDCQDLNVDAGQLGSWEVELRHGRPVPTGGQVAAGKLACEIVKSVNCDESCMLPERVQTVTRQGVTVGFMDPMTFLSDGLTGIYIVDIWIRSVNPYGNKTVARVRAPGQRKTGRLVRSHPGS